MSDANEKMLRIIADVLFNKQPTFSTKNIFKRIDKEKYEKNLEEVTRFVIKEMFCENTGSHFLDSGGAYGRGYDRANAIKHLDWMKQENAIAVVDQYSRDGSYDFYVSKNAYLFLCEHLDYDLEMDQRFHKFCQSEATYELIHYDKHYIPLVGNLLKQWVKNKSEVVIKKRIEYYTPKEESYYSNMTAWKQLIKQAPHEDLEDYQDLDGYNTSNRDSCLNKTLQWEMFSLANGKYEGHYIILQIHNGCDLRGGYSTPHVFTFDEDEFWSRIDDLTGRCPNFKWNNKGKSGIQTTLDGEETKDPVIDLDHVDCYSDDTGCHWYSNCGEDIKNGAEFKTDEDGKHHIVCKKCGAELEFW